LMRQFVANDNLQPLNDLVNMNTVNQQYSEDWISLGSVDNNLYAIFMKATNKSTIWYNPKTFTTNNWSIPSTWDELIALSDQIVSEGKTPANPWSVGVEATQASGFPATDWIAQIFLTKYGGEAYDQWINHEIPWTDPRIRDAWEMFGTIVNTPDYIAGGTTAVLATNFQDASYLPFQDPPRAAMYYEGDFVQGFISSQFPDLVAGEDYSFFPFPAISEGAAGSPTASPTGAASPTVTGSPAASPEAVPVAVTAGADLVVAFKDTPAIRSFISYLASPEAQTIWVERGGFISLNTGVSLDAYPNELVRMSAQGLVSAPLSRFGAGDMMPGAMQTAWWAATLQYLQNPGQLDSILTNLENTAQIAYAASPTATSAASPSPAVSPTVTVTPAPTASP
jgi:alpha-glucoside transport system substrate-binding protein